MSPFLCLFALPLMISASPGVSAAATGIAFDKTQVEGELWTKEQAIYAGRGRGDMQPYYDNTSPAYLGWPPQFADPIGREKLKPANGPVMGSKEKLEMTFSSITVSGDSALIYYKTHMTMRADGAPTDQRFEVVHAWVREGGQWRLLGGMARPAVGR